MNVAELVKVINEITPLNFAFDDDKVGLLIGSEDNDVSGILVACLLYTSPSPRD